MANKLGHFHDLGCDHQCDPDSVSNCVRSGKAPAPVFAVDLLSHGFLLLQGNDIFDPAWVLETVLDCCFVLDIVANFRTSYPSSSKEVISLPRCCINYHAALTRPYPWQFQIAVPSMIAKRYLRHWFALDLVTTLPFDTIVRLVVGSGVGSGVHSISILRMLVRGTWVVSGCGWAEH